MTYSKSCAGLSILETIMVLVIAGLIIGAIWINYGQVTMNDKVQRTVGGIYKTLENARDFLQTHDDVPKGTPSFGTQLLTANAYPADFLVLNESTSEDPPTLAPPLGAQFTATPNNSDAKRFDFNLTLTNDTECKKLALALFSNNRALKEKGVVNYAVNGVAATFDNGSINSLDTTAINANCPIGKSIPIVMTFSIRN